MVSKFSAEGDIFIVDMFTHLLYLPIGHKLGKVRQGKKGFKLQEYSPTVSTFC